MVTSSYISNWERCLQKLQRDITPEDYNSWIKPVRAVGLVDNKLYIEVPNMQFYDIIEDKYIGQLRKAIDTEFGTNIQINYNVVLSGDQTQPNNSVKLPFASDSNTGKTKKTSTKTPPPPQLQLNSRYTFDNFLEADCNALARKVGLYITDSPGGIYNPFFLYSGVGLGKTHLVQAVGNEIKRKYPEKTIVYTQADRFVNDFYEAIVANEIQSFKKSFMDIDVLIVDDIQFMADKDKMLEVFFYIFNGMLERQRQIILTSDRAPKDLKGMPDRLLSRFTMGVTADLLPPDYETRVAIVLKKARAEKIDLPIDVAEYIAKRVKTNIRELDGTLISIGARINLENKPATIEVAQAIIDSNINIVSDQLEPEKIIEVVADHFKIDVKKILGSSRVQDIVGARQISMYFIKQFRSDFTLDNIGNHFSGRHHTSVLHSIRRVDDLIATDPQFRTHVESIQKKLTKKS